MALVNEMFDLAENETLRISADDKNKVPLGTLAVSRYFNIRKYFPEEDSPNYKDHDWIAASKIVPSGYLLMRKPREAARSVLA